MTPTPGADRFARAAGEYRDQAVSGQSARGHLAVITAPVPGHLNPAQVLARALIAEGWRVSVVHLNAARRFLADPAIGFSALPDGRDATLDAYLATLVAPSGPVRLRRMIAATAAMTDRLLAGAPAIVERIGATAILADAVEPAGPLIAARLRLPHAVAITGLPLFVDADVPPPFVSWRYRPDALGRFRNRAGHAISGWLMRPADRVRARYRQAWNLADADRPPVVQVTQCPRGLDFPRATFPANFAYGTPWRDDHREPASLQDDGRPLVFCSLGTLQGTRRDVFAIMAQACATIGARAVIGHGGGLTPAEAASLPGAPLVSAFWPQAAVLRRCSAAVLHGGFNTVLDALAAGVPIVALPIGFEQPGTAARLVRIGAGLALNLRGLDVPTLARAVQTVVERPTYRQAAAVIAAEIAAGDGATGAAAAITAALTAPA